MDKIRIHAYSPITNVNLFMKQFILKIRYYNQNSIKTTVYMKYDTLKYFPQLFYNTFHIFIAFMLKLNCKYQFDY